MHLTSKKGSGTLVSFWHKALCPSILLRFHSSCIHIFHTGFFFFSFLLLTHWFSCLFYFLGDTNRDADGFWAISTANDLDSHITYLNYIAAICWTIMTLTTVGYGAKWLLLLFLYFLLDSLPYVCFKGDISSNGTPQRILSVLAMITGALFFAYGVSNIVSIVDEFRAESKVFKKRMEKFNLYMHTRNLPDELKVRSTPL